MSGTPTHRVSPTTTATRNRDADRSATVDEVCRPESGQDRRRRREPGVGRAPAELSTFEPLPVRELRSGFAGDGSRSVRAERANRAGPALSNQLQGTDGYDQGIALDYLVAIGQQAGLRQEGLYGPNGHYRQWTISDVMREVRAGYPVITLVHYTSLPQHQRESPAITTS